MMSVADETSDKSIVLYDELIEIFGTSSPGGNKQINSTKTKQISTGSIYCAGDMTVLGRFRAPIKAFRGIILPAGSASAPIITIGSVGTGLFSPASGAVTIVSGGAPVVAVSAGAISVSAPITSSSGNLVLSSAGPSIDFSGKSIINAAGGAIPEVGNPDEVIINSSLGALTSEPQLATERGGTNLDTSASTGFARVTDGTWSVEPLAGDDFGDDVEFVSLTASEYHQGSLPDNDSATFVGGVFTSDATPSTLYALLTSAGEFGSSYTIRVQITLIEQDTGLTGAVIFTSKAKNIAGVVTVSMPIGVGKILDAPLDVDAYIVASAPNAVVTVTGMVGRDINWFARIDVVGQTL